MVSMMRKNGPLSVCALLCGSIAFLPRAVYAQTFTINFARQSGPPLVKTRFGVYQTPLVTLPDLLNSLPMLDEINVLDFRYEIGWGKPESLGFNQISGTAQNPKIDFSILDALQNGLNKRGVTPLFALGYCPDPLKSRTEWAGWKDMPSDLSAWQNIVQNEVSHLGDAPFYEVWNEPDMPEPSGKMFFSGNPDAYGKLYAATVAGALAASPNARVGGGALAYDLRYFAPLKMQKMDFASIHAYDNWAGQIANLRGALEKGDVSTPLFLTEYASFTDLPPNGPQSRTAAAMRFFRDARAMLGVPDLSKVYWAQWLDAGHAPGMGLLTYDGHKKAIFNAFKIYAELPVDRCPVLPADTSDGVSIMASVDAAAHRAGVVLWNETKTPRTVSLHLQKLPFGKNESGMFQVFRIDTTHASFVDNPALENLAADASRPLPKGANETMWRGSVPGEGVVFIDIRAPGTPPVFSAPRPVMPPKIGALVQTRYAFADRTPGAPCADFDPRTGIIRLGMNERDKGTAQIGAIITNPVPRLKILVETGNIAAANKTAALGLRLEFSVSGTSGTTSPKEISLPPRRTAETITVNLIKHAPMNWDKKRVTLAFFLRDAGPNARALLHLSPASQGKNGVD